MNSSYSITYNICSISNKSSKPLSDKIQKLQQSEIKANILNARESESTINTTTCHNNCDTYNMLFSIYQQISSYHMNFPELRHLELNTLHKVIQAIESTTYKYNKLCKSYISYNKDTNYIDIREFVPVCKHILKDSMHCLAELKTTLLLPSLLQNLQNNKFKLVKDYINAPNHKTLHIMIDIHNLIAQELIQKRTKPHHALESEETKLPAATQTPITQQQDQSIPEAISQLEYVPSAAIVSSGK